MKNNQKIKIGISVGDINGIGVEIILKTFEDSRMLHFCTPVIFASTKILSFQKKHFKLNTNFTGIHTIDAIIDGKINVVNTSKEFVNVTFGEATQEAGRFAIKSLKEAVKALKLDKIDALVTAPINKKNVQSTDFNFLGHTDFLATELNGEAVMFMVAENLRIGLLTDHVAVKDISENITPELIEKKINAIEESLKKDFSITKPKIAVLGINPHSGDNGIIGKEDDTILKPTLQKLFDAGKLVFGPYAADGFFGSENYKNFDAVLAAYHDQGLIPFKTLSFGKGVNFTAGLDKIRTSPDHGTGYEIAGKGSANISSFKEAIFTAIKIFKSRKEYQQLTKNPLKKQPLKIK